MSFARWENLDACCLEQASYGHPPEVAKAICEEILDRANRGELFKKLSDVEIIKSGSDIVLYAPATWEVRDPEGDFITTEAQTYYLRRWLNDIPPKYRVVMEKHQSMPVGEPVLTYTTDEGKTYHTHTHEVGTMLLTKVRPDDGTIPTRELRERILNGHYRSYSIRGRPIEWEDKQEGLTKTRYHYKIDPIEVSLVPVGMNQRVREKLKVVQKGWEQRGTMFAVDEIILIEEWVKTKCGWVGFYKDGDIMKPIGPYPDWDACMAHMTKPKPEGGGGYDQETAKKVCGKLKEEHEGKSVRDLTWQHEALEIFKKYFPESSDP